MQSNCTGKFIHILQIDHTFFVRMTILKMPMNSIFVSHMLLISVSFKQISEFHFHHKIIFDINIFKQKLVESMICIIYHEFISCLIDRKNGRIEKHFKGF